MRTLLLLFIAACFAPACGDDSATGAGGSGNSSNNGAGPSTGGAGGGEQASCDFAELDLEGTWAIKVTIPASASNTAGGAFEMCPASQDGDVVVTVGMSVSELSGVFGARFSLCSVAFPTVTASTDTCATGTPFDLSLVRNNDRLFDAQTDSESIEVSGLEPGATFTLPSLAFYYGAQPLRSWDTGDVACDDPLLGHGGTCEEACIVGGCEDMDYWNDDFPGFTFGMCGLSDGQIFDDCDPDDPLANAGFLQGNVFTNVAVTMDISGAFDTSCQATATAPTTLDMSVVGGDIYVDGVQVNVTALANALPQFDLSSSGATVEMIRVDGKHGTPDYAENDLRDSCEAIAENLGGVP